jgi:thiamine biosynthesis lipoprotein ApbE
MFEWLGLNQLVRNVLLPLMAVVLGIWLGHLYNAHQQTIGAEHERLLCEQRVKRQSQLANEQEINWMTELSHAQSQAQKNKDVAQRAQRSADAAGRLFSSALASQSERATADAPGACTQYASAVTAVLDECQAAYREVAGQADGHAADALMLWQAWPK